MTFTKMNINGMEKGQVNFDFPGLCKAVKEFVRAEAIELGGVIVYREKRKIIEEDPRTGIKRAIEDSKEPK